MSGIAIIIVAAGASSRMNSVKQLLPYGDTTLLGNAITQATATTAEEVITVLGANFENIRSSVHQYAVTVVENKDWKNGLGSSIAAGLHYVLEKRDHQAVMIMLGDQPLIDTGYLNDLITSFQEDPSAIIATRYPRSNGVPAIFPKKYFQELAGLQDDHGAKYLLNSSKHVLVLDPGKKTTDIDTPEDYRKIQNNNFKY